MNAKLRQKAIELRTKERLSYTEIRKKLKVPKSTLSYWLHDYPLTEEEILSLRRKAWTKGEASRERFRNTMRRKKEQYKQQIYKEQKIKLKDITDDAQFVAGLMLYLGEGGKRDDYSIALSNTDSHIIRYFIEWLEKYLHISRKDIRIQLHLYEDMDIDREKTFWKKITGFNDGQFHKSQVRKLKDNSFSYSESYRHGTCQIRYSNKQKKTEIMMAIQAFRDLYM